MPKMSPGPFTHENYYRVIDADGQTFCTMGTKRTASDQIANVSGVLALPDLIAALERMLASCKNTAKMPDDFFRGTIADPKVKPVVKEQCAAILQAREALAMAGVR